MSDLEPEETLFEQLSGSWFLIVLLVLLAASALDCGASS